MVHRQHGLHVALHVGAELIERDHLRKQQVASKETSVAHLRLCQTMRTSILSACAHGAENQLEAPDSYRHSSSHIAYSTHVEGLLDVAGDALNAQHKEGNHHSQHWTAPLRQRPQQQWDAVDVAQQEARRVPADTWGRHRGCSITPHAILSSHGFVICLAG